MLKYIETNTSLSKEPYRKVNTYHANLKSQAGAIEGNIGYASKSSLFFKHLNGVIPENGQNFNSIEIQMHHNNIRLENCCFISENPSSADYDGQIIFTDEVYDFFELFSGERIVNLNSQFLNLDDILSQKNKIDSKFRDYTSNLNFDLNIYKKYFDKLDLDYCQEKTEILKKIEEIIFEKKGRIFYSFFNEKLDELFEITKNYSPSQHQSHANYFRQLLWSFISSSKFLYRTNTRPRGYAGDSGMLNMVYDNRYMGHTLFARLMHKHPIECLAADAVRNRTSFISAQLKKISSLKQPTSESPVKILSVACGPARELTDMIGSADDFDRYSFSFLDQDEKAIQDAKETICKLNERFNKEVKYVFYPLSVRSLLRTTSISEVFGKFDFIYSMGLYDYLTDRTAKNLTERLYQMLEPKGVLAIGNYHIDNPSRTYMQYWMDWVLCYRNEDQFLALTNDLGNSDCHIEFESTRSQMFAVIQKKWV